jgi:3-hydroxybutyryl-CoA dehydrogenase
MQFRQVGVVGLGTMGAGIVEVFARSGLSVVAVDVDEDARARGQQHLTDSTARAVARGRLSEPARAELLERVSYGSGLHALAEVDLVVEAVPERLDLKRAIFAGLDAACRPEAILATNTSSLSVTEIAASTSRPGKVVGMHFFNPAPVMKLVEVVHSVVTEADVIGDIEALAQRLGKVAVTVGDRAGFVANALLLSYLNHAVSLYESGFAGREDVDAAMRLGCGLPMGPLTLLDLIGLDVAYEVLETMYRQSRDRRHAPAPILKQLITAGLLGRKSGRGFYSYERPGSSTIVPDASTPADAPEVPGRAVRQVCVVGSGAPAARIVQAFAAAGYDVAHVEHRADTPLARSAGLAAAQLVVEAVADDRAVKQALFARLDEICAPGAVLATTTSSVPVIECAAAAGRLGEVIGMHFVDAPAETDLVEVVSTVGTAPDVEASVLAVCRALGKHPVRCGDRAGFLVNAMLFPYLNDAVKMLEARYATVEDVDAAMTLGCGYPMGPFEVLDAVGLDVALASERALYEQVREPGFAPAPLLEQLVTAGRLGRKSGMGFREH